MMKWKLKKLPVVLLQLLKMIEKLHKKKQKTCISDSSMSLKKKYSFLNYPAFLTSNVLPHTLKSSPKPDSQRDDSSTYQVSTGKFRFKSPSTSP